MADNPFRHLPAVNDILDAQLLRALASTHAHDAIVVAIRAELGELRERLAKDDSANGQTDAASLAARVSVRLERESRAKLRTVINATGIVLHTNLGRAPIAEEAARAAHEAASGYLNLELNLDSGNRSTRQIAIREWLCRLTGAESATAVNNNAAATVIALRTTAMDKEVVISRGQLIEIGGSFRIPDIMAVSGAILREVGTTNITRLADYEGAIGPNTGALLQVHSSNYRISGFTKSVGLSELAALGKKRDLPVIDDIGSGALVDFAQFGFQGEPTARASIAAGADLVLFSGDKLLGGPQAGIIVGRKKWIEKIEKDPLMRAFRLDKMTLAALEATLRLYLNEERALREVPVLRMLATPLEDLRRRAESLAARLRAIPALGKVEMAEDVAYVGGGSLPDQTMKSWVVEIDPSPVSDADLAQCLRLGVPAVVVRLRAGKLLLDVRTIFDREETPLVEAVEKALLSSLAE